MRQFTRGQLGRNGRILFDFLRVKHEELNVCIVSREKYRKYLKSEGGAKEKVLCRYYKYCHIHTLAFVNLYTRRARWGRDGNVYKNYKIMNFYASI